MNKAQIATKINELENLRAEAAKKKDHFAYLELWRDANWQGGREQAFREAKELLQGLLIKK